ncbi:MazG nucleotide pyrophosphohydrolase domain-containing protein [Streptomyces sp. NPDC006265]|uniref:MazG nucleotide pyrophosphohydrolase domain-containing protein n=1 Tax=Streptomyces sp. NPDC006265 TaxID=3156740 RepID=UPI0033AA9638
MPHDTTVVDFEAAVAEFHRAFDVSDDESTPQALRALVQARVTLIREEFEEVVEALENVSLVAGTGGYPAKEMEHVAKELSDLLYVVFGTADLLGIPLGKAFAAVHTSNMSKLGEDGKPIRREDGKVLKGPNYQPADLAEVFVDTLTNHLAKKAA